MNLYCIEPPALNNNENGHQIVSCDAELGIVLKRVFIGFRFCKNSICSHRENGIYDLVFTATSHTDIWQIWNKANLLQASPMVLNVKHFLYPKSAWLSLPLTYTGQQFIAEAYSLYMSEQYDTRYRLNNASICICHLSADLMGEKFLPLERSEDMWLVKMGPILTVVTIGHNLCSHSDLPTEWIDCC